MEFVATRLDFNHFIGWGKPQAAGDAVFQQLHVGILKFDDFFAIHTDKVVVSGMLEEIGIEDFCITPEIEFPEQPAFHKQRESAVYSGTRHRGVDIS